MNEIQVSWKKDLQLAIRSYDALLKYVGLSEHQEDILGDNAEKIMPTIVPLSFADQIEKNNINDPLLLQVLPSFQEEEITSNFIDDPLMETKQTPSKGIIYKYKSRVLFICNSVCAIHCRYCFRKHFDYTDNRVSKTEWLNKFEYIKDHPEINEVILSGGDPLLLNDDYIEFFLQNISSIKSVKRIRIHSRIPVILPNRITDNLIKIIRKSSVKIIIVIHTNHPNELHGRVKDALEKLQACSILLNQSVLLKKVNDTVDVLVQLSEKLFDSGVAPYYIHTLDKVQGCQHFYISDKEALSIYLKLQAELPGFLVPKMVKEVPFKPYKVSLSEFLLG
jgi:EF-P beta-lysylation protein EpmB